MVDHVVMPAEIAAAIVKVMGEVKKLSKDERNKHGGYNFASIDSFLEEVRPHMAAAGLIILPEEEVIDRLEGNETTDERTGDKKRTVWLKIVYSFTLVHGSGVTWARHPRRTVMVNAAMGSQAFGAAQSYAEKLFLRSLFKIATGDGEDADHEAPGEIADAPDRFHGPGGRKSAPPRRAPPQQSGAAQAAPQPAFDVSADPLTKAMLEQPTAAALKSWHADKAHDIQAMPQGWQDEFYPRYDAHMSRLKEGGNF